MTSKNRQKTGHLAEKPSRNRFLLIATAALAFCLQAARGEAFIVELKPATIKQFQEYVTKAERTMENRLADPNSFLSIDSDPKLRDKVRQGRIEIEKLTIEDVQNGLVHDWIGTIFIPGTSVDKVVQLLQDFDRHTSIYNEVVDSRTISKQDNSVKGFLRFKKVKVMTVVLNTEHEANYKQLDPARWIGISHSTRIAEVKDPNTPEETERPPNKGHGFLWRMNAYWRLRQIDGGVFAECRSISLSRGIPFMLSWIIKPIATSMPKTSLTTTLDSTRAALTR